MQSNYDILSSSNVGFEFEFYTEMPIKEMAKSLTKTLGKRVVIPVTRRQLKKTEAPRYHTQTEVTATQFKIEKDYSGGSDMYELVTGPMVYEEARIVMIKINQWIKEYGWTTSKCAIHLNCSFDYYKARKLRTKLMAIDVLKFILSFDEQFIWDRFPNRKNNVYNKSIDDYYPINRFVFFESPENPDRNDYHVPDEKYFGVNFTKLPLDYLELRYLGGQGYENRTTKILEILEYFIEKMYSCIQENFYTKQEKSRLHKKLGAQKKAVVSFSNFDNFLLNYPEIFISVDMKGDKEIIKSYWTSIREVLFDLIVKSGMKKGHLNLDTDVSSYQLKDTELKKANHVKNLEIFDSVISGTIEHCDLYRTKINSSRLEHCKLIENNEVEGSQVKSSTIKADNYLKNCYIDNPQEIINGKVDGGVIRNGIIGDRAVISDHTLIVNAKGTGKSGDKKAFDSYHDAFSSKK